jgi:hypothetical protein
MLLDEKREAAELQADVEALKRDVGLLEKIMKSREVERRD